MRLLTTSRYGVRMLLDIAEHQREGKVLMHDVSKRLDVSQKYLEKIARPLKKAGFLKGQRGPLGGHVLAKEPNSFSIGDVVRILESSDAISTCDEKACPKAENCRTRILWKGAGDALFAHLDSFTLADIMTGEQDSFSPVSLCIGSKKRK